jgi:hypothetical protein
VRAQSRVTHVPVNSAIRTWFDTGASPAAKVGFSPGGHATDVLKASAELFRLDPALKEMTSPAVIKGPNSFSVTFTQR